jgi:SAM-dependent methyltransferase
MKSVDWDDFSKKGFLQAVIDPRDTKGLKNALIDKIHWLALRKNIPVVGHLLDFGCGTGRFSQRIARLGIKYTGTDTSTGMIDAAKKYNPQKELQFINTPPDSLPFADGTFDVCLTVMVLQHLMGSRQNMIAELFRVLKPGGVLLSIEQVTLCGKTSGTVDTPAAESDYTQKLSGFFADVSIRRIRSCLLSKASWRAMRIAGYCPWIYRMMLEAMARFEIRRMEGFGEDNLSQIDYYDILIKAVKHG